MMLDMATRAAAAKPTTATATAFPKGQPALKLTTIRPAVAPPAVPLEATAIASLPPTKRVASNTAGGSFLAKLMHRSASGGDSLHDDEQCLMDATERRPIQVSYTGWSAQTKRGSHSFIETPELQIVSNHHQHNAASSTSPAGGTTALYANSASASAATSSTYLPAASCSSSTSTEGDDDIDSEQRGNHHHHSQRRHSRHNIIASPGDSEHNRLLLLDDTNDERPVAGAPAAAPAATYDFLNNW